MAAHETDVPGPFSGLSVKLIATIIFVILTVEVVIYLPSAANFRDNWLQQKISVGAVAVRVLDVVPEDMDLPEGLADRLLTSADAIAIAYRHADQSQLIEREDGDMPKDAVTADLRQATPMSMIGGALDTIFNGNGRTLRIVGPVPGRDDSLLEVLVDEEPLRAALLVYSRNIFFLSLIVAAITSLVIFLFVTRIIIRPIRRIVRNMMAYRKAPENAALIINPSGRADEIGIAERELAAVQTDLFSILRQRRHLADLGLAVAKINHDLRNTLTAAQLLSDQVATLEDPKVQRLAPRLVNTLDKAIGFAQSVLDYGRESAQPPKPQPVDLRALLEEAAFDAGLLAHPAITLQNEVPDAVTLKVDPDQMARVFVNLIKNAREALEEARNDDDAPVIALAFEETDADLTVSVTDNGPGLPPRAKDNLFSAFEGSARSGGTGLGLAIAREITDAHGGWLQYVEPEKGTRFEVHLPLNTRL